MSAAGQPQGIGDRRAAPRSPRPPGGSERRSLRGDHTPLLREDGREAARAASLGEVFVLSARRATVIIAALFVAGCGGESHQDLRDWMRDQGKGALGKLEPLPQIRPYEPFAYNAFDLPDPFKPRKIEPTRSSNRPGPDLQRRREPLEGYPLESLSMVGTLAKDRNMYALVRTPEKDIYQVRSGNFLGQNFGVVVGISDTEIKLKELVQDSAGDWTERTSTLQLQQPDAKSQGRGR